MPEVTPTEAAVTFDDWSRLGSEEAREAASNVHLFAKRHLFCKGGPTFESSFNWSTCIAELKCQPDVVLASLDQFNVLDGTAQSGSNFAQQVINALHSTLCLTIAANQVLSLQQYIVATFAGLVVSETRGFFSTGQRSSGSSFTYRVLCAAPTPTDPQRTQLLLTTIKISLEIDERSSWMGNRTKHKYEAFITAARLIVPNGFTFKASDPPPSRFKTNWHIFFFVILFPFSLVIFLF